MPQTFFKSPDQFCKMSLHPSHSLLSNPPLPSQASQLEIPRPHCRSHPPPTFPSPGPPHPQPAVSPSPLPPKQTLSLPPAQPAPPFHVISFPGVCSLPGPTLGPGIRRSRRFLCVRWLLGSQGQNSAWHAEALGSHSEYMNKPGEKVPKAGELRGSPRFQSLPQAAGGSAWANLLISGITSLHQPAHTD